MNGHPPDAVTYQYPDPDDAANGTRFFWAGDDNDNDNDNEYIPVALRQTLSSSWHGVEADDGGDIHLFPSGISNCGYESSTDRRDGPAIEARCGTVEHNESDEDVIEDVEVADSSDLAVKRLRSNSGPFELRQVRVRGICGAKGGRGRRGGLGRGNPGIKRGLRNPIEPEPEFKALHSQATMAFIANDYDEAEALTLQALQINPEMYPAHSLLSQIHAARGDLDKAIAVAYSGAHTRPRDAEMWSRIARMLLDRDQEHMTTTLRDAVYCYNRIISIDKHNVGARYQRAALNRELGKLKQVVSEYEQLNKYLPHDTTVLRHLAQASIEVNEPERALRHYKATVAYFQDLEPIDPTSFTWSDLNVLIELHVFSQDYEEGLELIKSLSRWLLGRRSDRCWDNFTEDDREWDINDQPRRIEFGDFVPNLYEAKTYGAGLPLDLRIKLGILRLNSNDQNVEEALNHFEWLDPGDDEIGAKIFDYPDLFRDVARSLAEKGLFKDAIRFYEPLKHTIHQLDPACISELAKCYTAIGRTVKGEAFHPGLLDLDGGDDDDEYSDSDTAAVEDDFLQHAKTIRAPELKLVKRSIERKVDDTGNLKELFLQWQYLKRALQKDQSYLKDQWASITQHLVGTFMGEKAFFPDQKHQHFMGYTRQARHLAKRKVWEKNDAADLSPEPENDAVAIPDGFGGISFKDWLEVFLEYGLSLAYDGRKSQAYQIMVSATQANVFYHSPDSLFLIHVCWFTCALLNNDDETLCSVARWFMKDCQFVTDAYRLFSALNRLSDGDHAWFNCGPSQKYILRQVKAMDFSLTGNERGRNSYQERSAYTAKDIEGNTILPQNMDVSLLMLYGHVLYAGKSYAYANNYFLRALSVDPTNCIIKLSLALGYIHHALKRQADNRHQLLMQGFAFLFEYYNCRQDEGGIAEKQEAAYNVARAFHMLGLTHLATPYYQQCLILSRNLQQEHAESEVEDFAQEAAFALQGIWAMNGNEGKALEITERWLQL